jgi:hypothetical protein
MAADRMARLLFGIGDSGQSEAVRLVAIKDALDRGGIQAKMAVSVEGSTKRYELVFDAIVAGPRNESRSETRPEIEFPDAAIESGDDDEILGRLTIPPPGNSAGRGRDGHLWNQLRRPEAPRDLVNSQ